ncbi:MAG TPA: hypothetical protein VKB88_31945 [Bryobacteraceae bacterium]|nr:hypothetical protein [Bryobacteraceae bacterium]
MKYSWIPGLVAVFAPGVWAQPTVVRLEGQVYLDDRAVERAGGSVPDSFLLRTEKGRVEVRLREGTVALGANSSLRVIANRPYNFDKFELLKGSAVIQTGEHGGELQCEDLVTLSDGGVFRLDLWAFPVSLAPGEHSCRLRVFEGAAAVKLTSFTIALKAGESMGMNAKCGDHTPWDKFDLAKRDDFDRWSWRRP